jgi:aerobic carbon-monoxide dehydrogenase medium subunit
LKAPKFKYTKPAALDEALEILASDSDDVLVLAGGQSLMPMLNLRLAMPDVLVDLNGLPDLNGIEDMGDVIRIGAMTRHVELEKSPLVAKHLPLISRAIKDIAHPAIRHRGTIGGSLALADPAAELPACALAGKATIVTASTSGETRIAADVFFQSTFETALNPGDLITAVEFPKRLQQQFAFREIARRKGDYAMAGVALTACGKARLEDVRIALFGVSAAPVRALVAEHALNGVRLKAIDKKLAEEIGELGVSDINFIGDLHTSETTKAHLTKVLIKRCVLDLAEK